MNKQVMTACRHIRRGIVQWVEPPMLEGSRGIIGKAKALSETERNVLDLQGHWGLAHKDFRRCKLKALSYAGCRNTFKPRVAAKSGEYLP